MANLSFIAVIECTVYSLMAYDNCREDPMICLTLAVASFGRAMQRQSDNRNYLVAQVRSPPPLSVARSDSDTGLRFPELLSQAAHAKPRRSTYRRNRIQLRPRLPPIRYERSARCKRRIVLMFNCRLILACHPPLRACLTDGRAKN